MYIKDHHALALRALDAGESRWIENMRVDLNMRDIGKVCLIRNPIDFRMTLIWRHVRRMSDLSKN